MENFETIIDNIDLDLGYWQHPHTGEERWYVNDIPALIGLELTYYNTGNISSAYYKGEKISNSRAKSLIGSIRKVWITADGKVHTQYWGSGEVAREVTEVIEAKISEAIEAIEAEEDATAVHITSPRSVANGIGAWSGTVEEYDADVLQYDDRFHRVVLERAVEGVFGEDVAAMLEDGDESRLPATLTEVAQTLGREEFAEFCEHLFDDPNVTLS